MVKEIDMETLMWIMKDIRNIVIMVLVGVLITLTYKYSDLKDVGVARDKELVKCEESVRVLKRTVQANAEADKEVLLRVEYKDRVIEKKIVEVQEIYVPQIKYIKEFVRIENETDCNASNRFVNSIVY